MIRAVTWILFSWISFFSITCYADPVRIICIGDSITQGGGAHRGEYTYRLPLFQALVDMGVSFDFIGTQQDGFMVTSSYWPAYKGIPFDPHHEGYYGKGAVFVRDKLRKNLVTLPAPDIALINLGSNDQENSFLYLPEKFVYPLEEIIQLLRTRNPKVTVLLATTTCCGKLTNWWMNYLRETLARKLDNSLSRVQLVDNQVGWKADPSDTPTDTYDWVHPNERGQKKMADNWMQAMKPFLKSHIHNEK